MPRATTLMSISRRFFMISLTRRFLVLSVTFLLLGQPQVLAEDLPVAPPEELGLSAEQLGRVSTMLQSYIDDGRLPGAVALVVRRGKVGYFEAFGHQDKESNLPMSKDSIFRIASQTKALISVGIMMLQEEGKLLISDPVGHYLPEFQQTTVAVFNDQGGYDVVEANRPITIRHLLTHTAGISYGNGPAKNEWAEAGIQGWYFGDRDEPIGATISRLANLPFDAQPGTTWIYGYAIDILGALIESVSGVALDEFLETRLLTPLKMDDTHFYLPQTKDDRLSVVYSVTETGSLERAPNPGHRESSSGYFGMIGQGAYAGGPRKSFSGGAGLLSTATDYARFLQMLLNDGELDGARILSRKSVELMTVNHLKEIPFRDGEGFGLGFFVVDDVGARGIPGSVGEFGWGGAYHSTYWVDPEEDLVVVYFTQVIPAGDLDEHGKLRTLVYRSIID